MRPWWPWTNVAWTWRWENAQGLSGRLQGYTMLPSGKRLHNYGKSPVSSWVNQWTKWPCSIATLVITRPGIPQFWLLGSGAPSKVRAGAPLNIGRLQLFSILNHHFFIEFIVWIIPPFFQHRCRTPPFLGHHYLTQMLHAWNIYLHLCHFWGKCR